MATTVLQPTLAPETTPDTLSIDLSRLLFRLESILLNPTPSNTQLRLLRRSQYDRNRVSANIEHARTLLFRLEHESTSTSSAKPTSSASDRKADTQRKRALLKKLQAALDELNHLPDDAHDADPLSLILRGDDSEPEDLVALYGDHKPLPQSKPGATPPAPAPAEPTATLRARKQPPAPETSRTGSSYTGNTASTTAAKPSTTPSAPASAPGSEAHNGAQKDHATAQLLAAHDSEQTTLTDSLVELAARLKESTQAFSVALESGNPLLDAAAAALDANVTGLDRAGRRMGSLRRMAEGRGWLARMGLYGWIAALWVALLLLVFVLPKLRFR